MSRPLRVLVPGGTYHVVSRGNERQSIFLDDQDRRSFIRTALQVRARFDLRVLTYCLMGNHYHLVVSTPTPTLSRAIRQLNGVHAQRFNRRHGRVGHLFGGRFNARLVQTDGHLLELARYVALNPVRAGLTERPEDWPWSAHRGLIGAGEDPLVDPSEMLSHFGSTLGEARDRYARSLPDHARPDVADSSTAILGTAEFVAAHRPTSELNPEVPREQIPDNPPPLSNLLAGEPTDSAIARAYNEHGYLQREIAEVLGCHYSTISRRLSRFEHRGDG